MGLLLIKECPCSDSTVQPKLKEENERKTNQIKVHLSGYTQGQHMWTSATRDIIEKTKRGIIIYKQV